MAAFDFIVSGVLDIEYKNSVVYGLTHDNTERE
jgi:hypothetical protein